MRFSNRAEAGRFLGEKLKKWIKAAPVILALPRGGLPVGAEVAKILAADLDILPIKKLGAPGHPELAMGAVSISGVPVWHPRILKSMGLTEFQATAELETKIREMREQADRWRKGRPAVSLQDRVVIIVDDGLATGASMIAAIQVVRQGNPEKIIVAVPVAPSATVDYLRERVDEVLVLMQPEDFFSVGQWYEDFLPVEDDEVEALLRGRTTEETQPVDSKAGVKEEIFKDLVRISRPVSARGEFDAWIRKMSEARVVMLGESTHGTEEFYQVRRRISERLVKDHGFRFIAVEGDWPDCHRLNRYILTGEGGHAKDIMTSFSRWPAWMWANEETAKLIQWLKGRRAGFYGLDVYSLFESLDLLKKYATKLDASIGRRIDEAYACFEPYERSEKKYAVELLKLPEGCESEVLDMLQGILHARLEQTDLSGEELFDAHQNAVVVRNAERYYRAMLSGGAESWNIRDEHMMDTLDALLRRHGEGARAIVWAHNTHIGDYHATDMLDAGYVNLGGLARERYGADNVYLVGLGTYEGEVLAGRAWGAPPEKMRLLPAAAGTYEHHLHDVARVMGARQLFLTLEDRTRFPALAVRRGHRAIGVVYQTDFERHGSNYVPTDFSGRYDAFVFVDHTSALRPIATRSSDRGLLPETWPEGQ